MNRTSLPSPIRAAGASALALAAFLAATLAAAPARAQSADEIKIDFARAIYRHSAPLINNDRPQPLLRAVVVLRVRLDESNHWQAEVFRENSQQPEMTQRAVESVTQLPPPQGLTPKAQALLHGDGLIEAWLFQNNGTFALKTLAKPQRGA
ncbi:MAG: hypothetical protein KGJ24_06755 [Burkholderiales bacterium]|nr:hypothetical protein [Burkholderiales bacterium]MDE2564247.1 hypothetical protein [Burkholderiales bacterium]